MNHRDRDWALMHSQGEDVGAGLNLLAVFALAELPEPVAAALLRQTDGVAYRQVLLVGHGGKALWEAVENQLDEDRDPVDAHAVRTVTEWLARTAPGAGYQILYPQDACGSPLLALGKLAGWHHPSPFALGVNQSWGSWFAYRALVVANTDFAPTPAWTDPSPCIGCPAPCVPACPADATDHDNFNITACANHRLAPNSSCASTCFARTACPIAKEHQYEDSQIAYHYDRSLITIRAYSA